MSLAPRYYFTDPARTVSPFDMVSRLPKASGMIFRHYNIENRAIMAKQLANLCKIRGLTFLVAADPDLSVAIGADGCHLPEHLLMTHPDLNKDYPALTFTAACHGATALKQAERSQMDAAFLSPIFATQSHKGDLALGLLKAQKLCTDRTIPIYGLGGITAKNCDELLSAGFSGFGAIGAFERGEFS